MIYSTMCIGEEWCKKHSKRINDLSQKEIVWVLTDLPEYFPNCSIQQYHRNTFSYYEKLPFVLNLVIKYEDRVTFFDADSVDNPYFQSILKKEYKIDNQTVYALNVYDTKRFDREMVLNNPSYVELMNIYRYYNYEPFPKYIHERLFSLPYKKYQTEQILEEIIEMQSIFEETYYKGRKWPERHQNQRWSAAGCGYAEGGALSIIVHNMNIPTKRIKYLKKII